MNVTMLILRAIHILCGAYWAGAVLFFAHFLEPVLRGAPAGPSVIQGLNARGYFKFVPMIAILTVLSGLAMLWMDSSGFSGTWMGTRPGMGFSTGGLFGILALVIGMVVMRPATERMLALGAQMATTPEGPARDSIAAEMGAVRKRLTGGSHILATFIVLAVFFMAISRYLA